MGAEEEEEKGKSALLLLRAAAACNPATYLLSSPLPSCHAMQNAVREAGPPPPGSLSDSIANHHALRPTSGPLPNRKPWIMGAAGQPPLRSPISHRPPSRPPRAHESDGTTDAGVRGVPSSARHHPTRGSPCPALLANDIVVEHDG
jgi:hypothetical protein